MTRLPSWADYGTYDESYYPELWEGCVGAWCPGLGPTGYKLFDLSINKELNAHNVSSVVSNGYALSFSGSNYVLLSDFFVQFPMTVCLWMCPQVLSGYCLAYSQRSDSRIYLGNNGDQSNLRVGTDSGSLPSTTLTVNVWYHMAVRMLSTTLYDGFVNGINMGQRETTTAIELVGCYLGCYNGYGNYFTGYVDDVRRYKKTLSDDEIKLLAKQRGISYIPRRRTIRRTYSIPAGFQSAWARNSNRLILPPGVMLP